ncbi:Gibberellin 2-beta-dioxygenase [Acorus calamus]|uniref:Gibberellin 2-beta-dioxygenase n=1 Tax=Acorus calamus TaxID=4465 RepID=A0AAV9DA69_ACOCL|nr:Gibberellin 2-beta-dioxygenase [Acorus calamus]
MVVLAKPASLEQISIIKTHTSNNFFTGVPVIDLSRPDSKATMIKACMELGFFKVVNHGIPTGLVSRLEAEAVKFFSLSQVEKERDSGIHSPFGYGSKRIGSNGDVGWLEYLLMQTNRESLSRTSQTFFRANPDAFRYETESAVTEYLSAVKKLACEVLEMMAEGLNIQPRNVFSKLLMDEESDSLFRLNHYPPCPQLQEVDCKLTGFGEHTDPQIISILRVSMIYFGGPPYRERLAPLPLLMGEGEESLYKEFTWFEYKTSAYKTRLADNRLGQFMK